MPLIHLKYSAGSGSRRKPPRSDPAGSHPPHTAADTRSASAAPDAASSASSSAETTASPSAWTRRCHAPPTSAAARHRHKPLQANVGLRARAITVSLVVGHYAPNTAPCARQLFATKNCSGTALYTTPVNSNSPAKWQRTKCPCSTSRNSGVSATQRSLSL